MNFLQISVRRLQSDRRRSQGLVRARLALLRRDQCRLRKLDRFAILLKKLDYSKHSILFYLTSYLNLGQ